MNGTTIARRKGAALGAVIGIDHADGQGGDSRKLGDPAVEHLIADPHAVLNPDDPRVQGVQPLGAATGTDQTA